MDALEEVMGGGSKDQTHIVKGKRTKRQRPQSPIPFSIAATNSSSGDGGGGYGSNGDNFNAANNHQQHNRVSSPETSAELVDSATEEEEDMANCLILLAQGNSRHQSKNPNDHDHDDEELGLKFTSKRSAQAYQCKTCYRIFPSFQALGGHRASHRKTKPPTTVEEKRPTMTITTTSYDDDEEQFKNYVPGNPKSSSKVHECSICGAKFTSGQALGGHMRRHRAPPIGTTSTTTLLSLSPLRTPGFESDDVQEAKRTRNVLSLDLDLNLPAPDVDCLQESKFCFASKQQQPQQQKQKQKPQQQHQSPLVLSATPTLVDCHY